MDNFTIDFCAEFKVYAMMRENHSVADCLALMDVDFRYPKPQWIGFAAWMTTPASTARGTSS